MSDTPRTDALEYKTDSLSLYDGWAAQRELCRQLERELADAHGVIAGQVKLANDELAAKLESLREDAERYRWLREPTNPVHAAYYSRGDYGKGLFSGSALDWAIDQARKP